MLFGTKQDENGQRYQMEPVLDTDGREIGLKRVDTPMEYPEFEIIHLQHDWKVWSRNKEAEPLTTCNLRGDPSNPLSCKICSHLPRPSN